MENISKMNATVKKDERIQQGIRYQTLNDKHNFELMVLKIKI